MKLIIGLGNPGQRYANTRHNIGFRVIDELAIRCNVKLKRKFFGNAKEAHARIGENEAILLEPLTFMNLSGGCVFGRIKKTRVDIDGIIVVCDDINLPLGAMRIKAQGSSGGHNGLESVIKSLRTDAFPRLRIGVKSQETVYDLADYVLSDFKKKDIEEIESVIARSADACECWIRDGIDKAMNVFNK